MFLTVSVAAYRPCDLPPCPGPPPNRPLPKLPVSRKSRNSKRSTDYAQDVEAVTASQSPIDLVGPPLRKPLPPLPISPKPRNSRRSIEGVDGINVSAREPIAAYQPSGNFPPSPGPPPDRPLPPAPVSRKSRDYGRSIDYSALIKLFDRELDDQIEELYARAADLYDGVNIYAGPYARGEEDYDWLCV